MNGMVYEELSTHGRAALADERDRLTERLETLLVERSRREAELSELGQQIAACGATIDALSGLLGLERHKTPASSPDAIPKAPGDSIIDAVSAAFSERGNTPIHYRELTRLVLERGIVLGGKDPAGTLLSILTNARYSDRFERCARGTYRPLSSEAGSPTTKLRKSRRRRRTKRSNV